MKKTVADMEESASSLAEDARELLAATAGMAETKVIEARKRLQSALERGREAWDDMQDRAVAQAKVADEVIRDHPYQSMGLAFGIGALLGILMARRS
ncbi:MAG TPA: hypothetical protein VNV43_12155 [Candidatus Acidoferrales bacterium]|nr:hypothetical protein [Candidatus Acidoferrales bacterium]